MNILSNIMPVIVALLVFSILVIVHEFGHFILAKKNGIKVEEFAVGMGPLLVSKQVGETLYSIRALPFGGFCRMLGEDADCKEERAFNNKSVLARISVVVAGPIMNFIFALLLLLFLVGRQGYAEPVVSKLMPDYPAAQAGLMEGDRIVSVNGERIGIYQDLQLIMAGVTKSQEMRVTVSRDGQKMEFDITPMKSPESGGYIFGFNPVIKLGIFSQDVEGYEHANFLETVKAGFDTMVFYVKSTVVGFIRLFTFNISKEEFAGPIGIIQVIGDSYETGLKYSIMAAIENLASLAALLSANLGVINLFPIPAMDGGRLLFLMIEGIRGKAIDPEKEGMIHFAGFVLLMAFMVYVAFNDITRIFL